MLIFDSMPSYLEAKTAAGLCSRIFPRNIPFYLDGGDKSGLAMEGHPANPTPPSAPLETSTVPRTQEESLLEQSDTLRTRLHAPQTQQAQLLGARHDISALTKLLEAFDNHAAAGLNVLRRSHTEPRHTPDLSRRRNETLRHLADGRRQPRGREPRGGSTRHMQDAAIDTLCKPYHIQRH